MKIETILILITSYFVVLLIISWITSKKANNAAFFIGGKKSPWYVVSFGMIGASLSGVTFISVPGWTLTSGFSYMQMVFGYLLGYAAIVFILLPLYYRLNLTSIYTYLNSRFGKVSYKTGSVLFLVSRIIGASFRLFLVAQVIQLTIFNELNIPFFVSVIVTIVFIWVYTFRGGIKTIIWTDTLQTLFMLVCVGVTLVYLMKAMNIHIGEVYSEIKHSNYGRIWFFDDFRNKNFFLKQFLSGAFITIVMTGLDQDMMQKNLSCKNLKDAQKNMLSYSVAFIPINLIFLTLGALLAIFSVKNGIQLPEKTDNLFPLLATGGSLPVVVGVMFMLGLIAAAYSSADSALTSLTTVFTIDILDAGSLEEYKLKKLRILSHILMSVLLMLVIMLFNQFSDDNVITALYKFAGYTYGPLLGLYFFGLFMKRKVKESWVPVIALISPVTCYLINVNSKEWLWGYEFGFEILLLNGFLMFVGLLLISLKNN